MFSGTALTSSTNSSASVTSAAGLTFANDGSLGFTSGFSLSGDAISLAGVDSLVTSRVFSSTVVSDTIGLALALEATGGTSRVTAGALHNLTLSGNLSGTGALVKLGSGTVTLAGNNTNSGATSVLAGGLVLDYSTNNSSKLADGASLTLGSGVLTLSGGSHAEVLGSTSLVGGATIDRSSGTSLVRLGAITREAGGTLYLTGTNSTTTNGNTNGIVGGWALVNQQFAAVGTSGTLVSVATTTLPTSGFVATTNYAASSAVTLSSGVSGTLNSLRFSANNQAVTLGNNALTIESGGISLGQSSSISGTGSVTAGSGGNYELFLWATSPTTSAAIGSNVLLVDNGTNAVSVTKSGNPAGISNFSLGAAASTYTGKTRVVQGQLTVTYLANGGAASPIGQSTSDAANLVLDGGGLQISGSSNVSTNRLFTLGVGGGFIVWNQNSSINFTNTGEIAFSGTGARTLTLQTSGKDQSGVFSPQIGDGPGGATTLVRQAAGAWSVLNANTYTGPTVISAASGTSFLVASSLANGGVTSSIGQSSADAGNLVLDGGGISLSSTVATVQSTDRLFTLGVGGATLDSSGGATSGMAFTGAGSLAYVKEGARSLTLQGTRTGTFAPQVGDGPGGATSLVKSGTGSWVIAGANTFTGSTSINAGTLVVSSLNRVVGGDPSSSLGSPGTVLEGTIALGVGADAVALRYTGTGETTDRILKIATTSGGVTLDQSGSGVLKFTSSMSVSSSSAKTITLQGSTNGSGEFAGTIPNGAGSTVTSLTKAGSGIWRLSGTNTYTGVTTVSAGVLSVSSTAALPGIAAGAAARYTVSAGAALVAGDNVTEAEFNTLRTTGTFAANSAIGFDVGAGGRSYAGTAISNIGTGTALGFVKIGSGTLSMNVANTYTGTTTIREGTLRLGAAGALPANSPLVLASAGLDMATSATAAAVSITGVGSIVGSSSLTATSYAISNTTGTVVLSAPLAGSSATFTKSNAGTVTLSGLSSFGGAMTVSGGVLEFNSIANSGTTNASALGAPAAGANSTIALSNDATLRYTGTGGHSSDRTINLATTSTGTATLDGSGAGGVTLGGGITAASGAKTLLLTGTSLVDNTLGVISNPTGSTTSLLKRGDGRWVLSGVSTFTGPTTIEQGELVLGVNSSSSSGALGSNSLTAPITIGSTTGSGTAALLLKSGVIVDTRAFEVPVGGSQVTVIGGADASGTASFSSVNSPQISLGRDVTLQAATGGTITFDNVWEVTASGSSVQVTVGSLGNAGTVVLGTTLGTTGSVIVDRGTLRLGEAASIAAASNIVVGVAGAGTAFLDVRDRTSFAVGASQSLGGGGTLRLDADTPVSIAGLFSPGNSPGLFTFDGSGTTTLAGSTLMEITGTSRGVSGGYDAVNLTDGASLVLGGELQLWFGSVFDNGTTFDLFSLSGTGLTGNFTSVSISGSSVAYSGLTWTLDGTTWNSTSTIDGQSLRFDPAVGTLALVPEPATVALAVFGIVLGGVAVRRRRNANRR